MKFSKMHGLGNDFVVLDGIRQTLDLAPARIRALADRRTGVGCDQVLVAEATDTPGMDVRYRIFNADGSEAGHCGNGVRCLAVFLEREGLVPGRQAAIETENRVTRVQLLAGDQVRVDMGEPGIDPLEIPLATAHCLQGDPPRYRLRVGDDSVAFSALSMGNPHAVLVVASVDAAPVTTLGAALEWHPAFPAGVNVGFMQIIDRRQIRLRVFERGCGETRACGTGACAAVAAGRLNDTLDPSVSVDLPGGQLQIEWPGPGTPLLMTGPAVHVFDGVWP